MQNTGFIRMVLGLLLVFGAVGGMEQQPGYFGEQILVALSGLALMFWATVSINRRASETVSEIKY